MANNNYTLGRGELWFAPFIPSTQTPRGERYIGNSPEFSIAVETENLDHYNSDRGVREKDESIALQTDRNGSFTTDNVAPDNLALFFFGSTTSFTDAGGTVEGESIGPVEVGLTYQVGVSANNPAGARGLSAVAVSDPAAVAATGTVTFAGTGAEDDTVTIGAQVYTFKAAPVNAFEVDVGGSASDSAANLAAAVVATAGAGSAFAVGTTPHPDVTAEAVGAVVTVTAKVGGEGGNTIALTVVGTDLAASGATLTGGSGTVYVADTDYTLDADLGRITILVGGAINEEAQLAVDYTTEASTRERMVSGSQAIEGQLRYIAYNPAGKNFDYLLPWVKITPNGDFALKGDEWQTIPFSVEVLKLGTKEAVYIDGRPHIS